MADAVTTQILEDGARNVVMKFTSVSDGTGETNAVKVNLAALTGAPSAVKITEVQYDISGMQLQVQWDATAPKNAVVLSTGQQRLDFSKFGGLVNDAGAGKTGNIVFTTIGASVGDTYTVVLRMRKK